MITSSSFKWLQLLVHALEAHAYLADILLSEGGTCMKRKVQSNEMSEWQGNKN